MSCLSKFNIRGYFLLVVLQLVFSCCGYAGGIAFVDIGDESQQVQEGWAGWNSNDFFTKNTDFGEVGIQLNKTGTNGVRFLSTRDSEGELGDLIDEFVFARELELVVSGLSEGVYNLDFCSNDPRGFEWAPFYVYLSDALVENSLVTTLPPTAVSDSGQALRYRLTFSTDGFEETRVKFVSTRSYPDSTGIIPLNGFCISQLVAENPVPRTGQLDVPVDVCLQWQDNEEIQSFDVYGGSESDLVKASQRLAGDLDGDGGVDFSDLLYFCDQWLEVGAVGEFSADLDNDGVVSLFDISEFAVDWGGYAGDEYLGNNSTPQLCEQNLPYGTKYYWRVDSRRDGAITKGDLWYFTTADYADQFLSSSKIDVYASNSLDRLNVDNIINCTGLHNVNFFHDDLQGNMWLCENDGTSGATHPLQLDSSAWVKFEFDKVYSLGSMWLWNWNAVPVVNGLRQISIYYSPTDSADINDWMKYCEIKLPKAWGESNAPPAAVIDFGGCFAKYVVVSVDSVGGNWGGDYYGLSEVRFNTVSALLPSGITASASSSYGPRVAGLTADESGMSGGEHDTSSANMWMSAAGGGGNASNHPFGLDGAAWIKYEFDNVYNLSSINVWNCNMSGNYANRGLRNVSIHYSITGSSSAGDWTKLGDYELSRATGSLGYECNNRIAVGNADAKYVVITASQTDGNWGDPYYYSLSEVRFGLSDEYAANPSPWDGDDYVLPINLELDWTCGTDAGLVGHDVYYGSDFERVYCAEPTSEYSDVYAGRVTASSLTPTVVNYGKKYYWRVDEVYSSHKAKGRVWSFQTPEVLETKISTSMPKINTSVQIESEVLLPANVSLPGSVVDFYVRNPQGQTSLISQVNIGSDLVASWTPSELGEHHVWSKINSERSQEVELFVTPVVRNFHYWWPNLDQKWITSCIVHDVEPQYWSDRGVLATKWKYGDDSPYDKTVSAYYDHWSDIEAGYGGITIDEFPYQGVENVVMGDALGVLKTNNPEIFICAYSVKVDLTNTDLIADFTNVDLLLMETYAASDAQYVRFDRYDSAEDAGLGSVALASIAVEDQNVTTVAELRKQFAYVRATRPQMTGIALYGTHVDDDKHDEMMEAVDEAIYDYFLGPALLLELNRQAGNLKVKNIGSLPIDSVNVILNNSSGTTVTTISTIAANGEAVVSIPYDCISAEIEEDSQRYTVVKDPT